MSDTPVQHAGKQRIWDLPVRLFHWSLVIAVSVSLYTGFTGGFVEMDYHMLSGYCILALVAFRILWGFTGTRHAKFLSFIPGPGAIVDYLKAFRTSSGTWAGHNPLGALSVIVLLLLLSVQAVTGLFTNDDIMLEGPLSHLVSYDTARSLTEFHKQNAWAISGFVGLHIIAIAFYSVFKRAPLIVAMITGKMPNVDNQDAVPFSPLRELLVAGLLMLFCGATVYAAITYL